MVRGGGNLKEFFFLGYCGVIDCLDIDVMFVYEFIIDFRVFSSICNLRSMVIEGKVRIGWII